MNQRQNEKKCKNIIINIDNQHNNYFLSEEDVLALLTRNGEQHVIGTKFASLDIKALERQVEAHHYVQTAQVFRDLKGNILVTASQSRPIARFLLGGRKKDVYISDQGEVLPFSERYSARVPLVTGAYAPKLINGMNQEDSGFEGYLKLFRMLDEDQFWRAQIAHIELDKSGEIILHPQVTKQIIEFGKPKNIELKLSKLKIFYKKILPFKGWNEYYRVNLKYRNQIVCE